MYGLGHENFQSLQSQAMGTLGYGKIWKLITEDSPTSAETDHSTYSGRSSTPTSVTSERSFFDFSDGERKRKGKVANQVLSTMVFNNG
jgi:hypothetical protein